MDSSLLRETAEQCPSHFFDRGILLEPDFEAQHALVKQHREAVGTLRTGFVAGGEQRRPEDKVPD